MPPEALSAEPEPANSVYPRQDYAVLGRYLPDQSPVAADLSDNCNLWGAHPAALEVLNRLDSRSASRYPGSYSEGLATALAGRYGLRPDTILTGVGATGVLDTLMRAVEPTTMRFLDPGWPAAGMLARMNGHTPLPVPWRAGLDDPDEFAGNAPAIVFVANPNNPTGEAVPDDWIRAVQERTERVGSVLIIDEAYGEYGRGPDDLTPFDMALSAERTLCVKTFSKAYGLAGMRVGYGAGNPKLVLECDKARGPFAVNRASSEAAAAAIGDRSGWLDESVERTRRNRDRLRAALRERGHQVPRSAANFVFIPCADGDVDDMADRLERRSVRTFRFKPPAQPGCPARSGLRATVGPWDKMQRLIDALESAR